MDEDRTIPAISAADAESFWTEGSPAYPAPRPGADVPESFWAESSAPDSAKNLNASSAAATLPGREYVAGAVPEPLHSLVDRECGGILDATGPSRTAIPGEKLQAELSPAEVAVLDALANGAPRPGSGAVDSRFYPVDLGSAECWALAEGDGNARVEDAPKGGAQ